MNWHFLHVLSLWVAGLAGLLAVARTVFYLALVSDKTKVLLLQIRGLRPVWKGWRPLLLAVAALTWFLAGYR